MIAQPKAPGPVPNVLVLTHIFPHSRDPGLAPFNRQQITSLAQVCNLGLVAPIPFAKFFAPARPGAALPAFPFPVTRPLFWYFPGILRAQQGRFYLASVWPALRRMAARLKPRAILATWLYPDGWAALQAGNRLGLPVAVKLHGSDLHTQAQDPVRRPHMLEVLKNAAAIIAVSRPLARAAQEMGAPEQRIFVAPNGIDHDLFHPQDQSQAREHLGLSLKCKTLLFVGHLEKVKGPDLALEALARTRDIGLIVLGTGVLTTGLKARAAELGLSERVEFKGQAPHQRVAAYLAASDGLILPSRSEGEPNAVLEALAAGRPVLAARVGGVSGVVTHQKNGILVPPRDPAALARGMDEILARSWDPRALAASVAGRSWQNSAAKILGVLGDLSEAKV